MDVSTTSDLLSAALTYAARGWAVFPIKPRGKTPLTSHGLKDATCDPATIKAWWQRWPTANIGLPAGRAAGFVVVDIDPRHGGDVTLDELIARHGILPPTPESMTGGGGRHLLFGYDERVRNSANNIGPGIDTRGDGGYIVAPPSVHASGKAYVWEWSGQPDEVPLAEIPEWLVPGAVAKFGNGPGNLSFSVEGIPAKATGEPVPEGGRNNAAASLAGQYITAGDSLHEVRRKLAGWNATNPRPLMANELDSVVASVAVTHARNNPMAAIPVVDGPTNGGEACEPPKAATVPPEPEKPMPGRLLAAPGFVGDIVNWINRTAIKPQPVLALANALAFFGAVVGRKVQTPTGLRTNLYCLGVGESGSGKDHSRKQIKRLCAAAGITDKVLGGEDVSSGAAILSAVTAMPTCLFQFDEIGHMFAAANNKNAATYTREIPVILTKLFTSANSTFLGKEYADRRDRPRADIDQPNACVYGTTVPGRFFTGIGPDEIRDGFLGRMLVFTSTDPDPTETDVLTEPVPEGLVTMVQAWWQRQDPTRPAGNIAAVTTVIPQVVPFEPKALELVQAFRARCRAYKAATRDGSGLDAIWVRAVEHASKVAIVVACGCELTAPVVSEAVAGYAVDLVEELTKRLVKDLGEMVGANDHERLVLAVVKVIREAGPDGIRARLLARRFRSVTSRELNDVVKQVLDSYPVRMELVKMPSGPAAKVFVHE